MSSQKTVNLKNGDTFFYLEQLSPEAVLTGFIPNIEFSGKNRITISMRKDIYS